MVRFIKHRFNRRTVTWLVAIMITLVAAMPQPIQATPGDETLALHGTATLDHDTDGDGDTAEVDLGGMARWQVDYENTSGNPLANVKITNALSAGQTYVAGSTQVPPGWTTEFSTNGGSSYVAQEPASGITHLRFAANLVPPSEGGQITALPSPLLPVSQGTGGDGYIPILAGDRIYAVFHHQGPNAPVLSCIDRNTNRVCTGYPKVIGPYWTSYNPGGGIFFNNRIYIRAQSQTQFGLLCWDSTTNASCGFTLMANLPVGAAGYLSDRGVGPRAIGTRIYMVSDDHQVHCFDLTTQALCSGYPKNSMLSGAVSAYQGANRESGRMDMELDGSRIYATISGLAGGGISGAYLHCFDTATAAPCADWSGSVHENNATYYGLFFRKDTNGTRNGICMTSESTGTPICYDLNGTNRALLTQMPPTFPCSNACILTMLGDAEAGARTIFADWGNTLVRLIVGIGRVMESVKEQAM